MADQVERGVRPGDVLADRYLLVDLLTESGGGRFWRAHDRVLARHVALHVLGADDRRAPSLLEAARRSATVADRRLLRVLDAEERDGLCFVVNEWGSGRSLDIVLATEGPMSPRRAAWVVREAADGLAAAHANGVPHGHLIPENLLIDRSGAVRLIGFAVDAALRGLDATPGGDVRGLAALLYSALTGRWPGPPPSQVAEAPREGVMVLRPRQVRAGIPRALDTLCDEALNPPGTHLGGSYDAARLSAALAEVVGDDTGMAAAEAARHRTALDAQPPYAPWAVTGAAAATAAGAGTAAASAATDTVAAVPPPVADSPVDTPAVDTPAVDTPAAPAAPAATLTPAPATAPTTAPSDADRTVHLPAAAPAETPSETPSETPREAPETAPEAVPQEGGAVGGPEQPGSPTQAGMPIFDDEADEVDWLRHHTDAPTPPPPFDEPPERPLFAPGPPDDARTHRGRLDDASRAGSGTFWPWDTGQGGPGAPPPPLDEPPTEGGGRVPGRRSLVVAVVLIVAVLAGIGGVVAYNAGRDGELLGPADEPTGPAEPRDERPAPEQLTIEAVTDLDPQGDPPLENPETTPLAADGDPETAWTTSTYAQQFGPEGLKTGLGLLVDLGEFADVAEVRVQVEGQTTLGAYVADTEPTGIADLTRVAEGEGTEEVVLTLDEPDTGRFVVVWIDQLPEVSDGFRAEIAEITVLG